MWQKWSIYNPLKSIQIYAVDVIRQHHFQNKIMVGKGMKCFGCNGLSESVRYLCLKWHLTLNVPITTKVVCFSCLLKCLRSLYGKPIGAVWSGSTLFASILNSSVMLGNYLQQATSADNIFRCIFFLAL